MQLFLKVTEGQIALSKGREISAKEKRRPKETKPRVLKFLIKKPLPNMR